MTENISGARKRKAKRARKRNLARQQRQLAMMEGKLNSGDNHAFFRRRFPSYDESKISHRALAWLFSSRSPVAKLTTVVTVSVLIFFIGSYVLSDRIFPNVYAMGLPVGELTPAAAETAILKHWDANLSVEIWVDGEKIDRVGPDELGLTVDAAAMVIGAKAVGLAGIPFGYNVEPVVTVSHSRAQSLLLDLTESIYVQQYEAGYKWSGGRLVTVPGRRGRHLDIKASLDRLKADAAMVVSEGRFELQTIPLNPTVADSSPFLDAALVFLESGIRLRAYDPFKNDMIAYTIDQQLAAEWLIAGVNGLAVRAETFGEFIAQENEKLVRGGRYLDKLLATSKLQEALIRGEPDVTLRLNYLPVEYEIVRRDTGFRVGRKRGIPFELIRDANPTVNWNSLVVGQTVQIPSRDVMIPADPIPTKRIIVDLEAQWLVGFENGELLFDWGISSGREEAPTYPGIFQILTHNEKAFGGSYALCNEAQTNCNQWEMAWFMGIYEVLPGLMNGFHGAVLLPNGNYLGGGGVYEPSTFGCIMSVDGRARELYEWAEKGTMVEIISDEFAPESDLARYAKEYISTIDTNFRPVSV
ncbi:MAG: peptidoglycan binding domain-containing protein [Chloroflexi bacterium]|nr:peptidoglycan binding domain-containing protein [Chloroflexota bacterium]